MTEQTEINALDIINDFGGSAFEGLVAKGVLMLLFPMVRNGSAIQADTSENLLHGYKVGGFTGSGETVDSEELQDQLTGGAYKAYISGSIDAGDMNLTATFDPDKGPLKLTPMRHSRVVTPNFVYLLATTSPDPEKLDVFLIAGVNYLGGRDIKGDYGKVIGTSFKFKITGKPKVGTKECGRIAISLYGELTAEQRENLGLTASTTPATPTTEVEDDETP